MAENQNGQIVKKSYKAVIETFSIWAAVGFVISGIVSAITFYSQFRMNYFSIAQPTDIVMGGFINISLVVAMVIIFSIGFYAQYNVARFVYYCRNLVKEQSYDQHIFARKEFRHRRFIKVWAPASYALSLAIVFGFDLLSNEPPLYVDRYGIHFSKAPFGDYWERPLSVEGLDNLYLSASSDQFATCGHAPVLWMGSSTVILNCRGYVRLIQNTENLPLDRLSPTDIEQMRRAEFSATNSAERKSTLTPPPSGPSPQKR
ncbi:hypothetical protein ACFX59_02325 [Sphingomonas sp. NCPPB 2930]|uniref:hypothetical protein n=1 Tax=Sphingomonas sp. NCPPB 2930 TaxID=3162788 RepID=UPI0036D9902D